MKHLVVGGDGTVGTALCASLKRRNIPFDSTTRRSPSVCGHWHLDLLSPKINWPDAQYDVVYLVAAVPKFAECERDPATWRVNVDAPIALARMFRTAFKVFISSDVVEYAGNTAYARQKAHVESYMQSIDAGIVRPSRIIPHQAIDFADYLIKIANEKRAGVSRWPDI